MLPPAAPDSSWIIRLIIVAFIEISFSYASYSRRKAI
jgi:hypothetical protein